MAERRLHGSEAQSEADDGEAGSMAVARYLADMTRQLEAMARASKLELLAYLLSMARAEAENVSNESHPDNNPNPY